jgi:hypothetical protein
MNTGKNILRELGSIGDQEQLAHNIKRREEIKYKQFVGTFDAETANRSAPRV